MRLRSFTRGNKEWFIHNRFAIGQGFQVSTRRGGFHFLGKVFKPFSRSFTDPGDEMSNL